MFWLSGLNNRRRCSLVRNAIEFGNFALHLCTAPLRLEVLPVRIGVRVRVFKMDWESVWVFLIQLIKELHNVYFTAISVGGSHYRQRFCIWLVACKLENYFRLSTSQIFKFYYLSFLFEIVKFKNLATFQICLNFD